MHYESQVKTTQERKKRINLEG